MHLEEILRRTKEVCEAVVKPNAARIDKEARWPQENIRALQIAGLAGLVVPKESGGLGEGLLATAQVCEMLGKECASTALCFGMHCVGAAVIAAKATPYQKEQYLEPIARGKHITTLSLSEPGTGAHFYYPQTQLKKNLADTYVINGEKSFVTNGGQADSYVVSAITVGDNTKPGQFSCILLPKNTKGLGWGEEWQGLGMRGNSSRNLVLKKVEVSVKELLGQEGDQIWYVFHVITPYFLVAMSGTYLGIATAALEEALGHLEKRRHTSSGSKLSQYPVLQYKIGVLWAQVERTRQFMYAAARQGDEYHTKALLSILAAKAEVADCVTQVVNEVMTIMGGIGYRENSKMGRHLRDARAAHVMAPTTDLLRIWAGRALLGIPLLGD